MKTIKSISVFVVTSLCAMNLSAQNVNSTAQRRMLDRALTAIEDYESLVTLGDDETYYSFLDLFTSDQVPVYNDLLGISSTNPMKLKDYVKSQRGDTKRMQVQISNITKDKVWYDEASGKWKLQFSFDKNLSYSSGCGIYISTNDFYQKDYRLTAVMNYDENSDRCKIESITGKVDSNKRLPDQFFIVQHTDARDDKVKYAGQTLLFNNHGQAWVTATFDKNRFVYADADVQATPTYEETCKIATLKYKSRPFRIRPHFDIALGDFYKIKTESDYQNIKSSGNEFGFDFGYSFPSQSKVKFSLNIGLLFTRSSVNISQEAYNYSYMTTGDADIDGDKYTRSYEIGQFNEKLKMSHMGIPFYADVDFCFSRYVSAFLQAGVKPYIKMSAKLSDFSGSEYIYGKYPQYDNLIMDEHWGYNNFGNHEITSADVEESEIPAKTFSMDIFGGAGLRIKPFKIPLALELGLTYQNTILDMWDTKANGGHVDYSSVMPSSYTVKDGEKVRLLDAAFSSVKRQRLQFNIGLVYKF